jgi:hypothetical protein
VNPKERLHLITVRGAGYRLIGRWWIGRRAVSRSGVWGSCSACFFAALVIPTAVLVYHAFGRLTTEAFYQHRVLAEELANRIDARVRQWIRTEERGR